MKLRRTLTIAALLVNSSFAVQQEAKSLHPKKASNGGKKSLVPAQDFAISSLPAPRGGAIISASKKASVLMGFLLAFNSGFVNGCCLSGAVTANGAKQAVAAVTASWTNSALGLASGNMDQFKFLGKILLSFISGSAIAGYLNPKPVAFSLDGSPFASSFYVGAILLVLSAMKLGNADTVKTGFCLAAMANGLQNSVTSTLTQNLCRTSHFTGISSDMGTFLGQILRGNKENVFKLKVFTGLAASFWLGGFASFEGAKQYGTSCLFASAGLYVLVGSLYSKFAMAMFESSSATVTMQKQPVKTFVPKLTGKKA